MFVIVFVLACVVLLDALVLLLDPGLFRRGMAFVEKEIGPAWMVADGFVFLAPGLAWLVRSFVSDTPVLSAVAGLVSTLVGAFCVLAATERFAYLGRWWRSRSNGQYRLAGVVGLTLGVLMLSLALELRP
ncbi:MAG: hypothetical protein KO254_12970 [Methanoculleus marisnigri]|jgi:hypothetical protein|nr:hypothetical protein [Methanoculleus marisnigri]